MNDAYLQYCRTRGYPADAVAMFKQQEQEDSTRKRALIMNGAHPDFLNGHPKDAEKGRIIMPKKRKKKKTYGY
jgi:hypothetical protein